MIMYERFVQLLQENNITPYRVSKETGVTQTTLSDWKNGRATPKTATLQKIADYFNVSVDWLTGKSQLRNNNEIGEYYSGWGHYMPFFEPPFEFAELLKGIREEQGVSIEEMAAKIGVLPEQYSECEDGTLPLSYNQAEVLCDFLGTNVSQVLFDNNQYSELVPDQYHDDVRTWERMKYAAENEAMKEAYADEDIKIVARHLEEIPSDKRDDLIKTINSTINMYRKAIGLDKKEN
jgi:transcriptional regulator with XRE-family HTH domain